VAVGRVHRKQHAADARPKRRHSSRVPKARVAARVLDAPAMSSRTSTIDLMSERGAFFGSADNFQVQAFHYDQIRNKFEVTCALRVTHRSLLACVLRE
jgi:hypothetical protein